MSSISIDTPENLEYFITRRKIRNKGAEMLLDRRHTLDNYVAQAPAKLSILATTLYKNNY